MASVDVDPRIRRLHELVDDDFQRRSITVAKIIGASVPEGQRDSALYLLNMALTDIREKTFGIILKGLPSPEEMDEKKDEEPQGYYS